MSGSKGKNSADIAGTVKKCQEFGGPKKEWEGYKEEEVTEGPMRFTTQKMARGFSLFEEALFSFEAQGPNIGSSTKVAAAFQNAIQCYPVIYDEKKRATPQISLGCFLKRVDRIESSKEPEPEPLMSSMNEITAHPPSPPAPPYPTSSLSSPPHQAVTLLASSRDASPRVPPGVPYYCTFQGLAL